MSPLLERLEDVFFLGAFAMEQRAVVLVEGLATGFAAEALLALARFWVMLVVSMAQKRISEADTST